MLLDRPSVCPSTYSVWHNNPVTEWRDFNESWHKYSSCDLGIAEKVFKVRGQGHNQTN